jgi:hypothetical protein
VIKAQTAPTVLRRRSFKTAHHLLRANHGQPFGTIVALATLAARAQVLGLERQSHG